MTSPESEIEPGTESKAGPASPEERRRARMAILARAPAEALEAAVAAEGPSLSWRVLRGPETGMVMVRGRMGGTGSAFNLGEMTVTRCAVRLADGRVGHAYLAGRDRRRAELAAVLDAASLDAAPLGAEPPGRLAAAIEAMAAAEAAARDDRSRRAAATRVEFYSMVRMG